MKNIYQWINILFLCIVFEEKIPVIFHMKDSISRSSLLFYQEKGERKIILLGDQL